MITPREKELLDYLTSFATAKGYAPSYRQMAAALDVASISGIHRMIQNLKKKGLITTPYNGVRTAKVNKPYLDGIPMTDMEIQMVRLMRRKPIDAGTSFEPKDNPYTALAPELINEEILKTRVI